MRTMKRIALLIAGFVFTGTLSAQQIPQYAQYYINPFVYNPAFAGSGENINSYLIHRSMFQKFPGAPVTNAFTIDGPLAQNNIGLGLSLYSDASDLVSRMGVKSAYSYKVKLTEDMDLNFGLGLGISETRVDFSRTIVRDLNDPFILRQEQRKVNVDADFGTAFSWKDLVVSVAVPQLLESKARFASNDQRLMVQAKRHYLASASYRFSLVEDKGISAYPLVLVRYTPGSPFSYDINAIADWEDKGWFAVSYKNDYAIGLNLGVRLNKTLSAGYTYDIITSPIKSYAGMSHEILLGFSFGGKKESPVPSAPAENAGETRITELEGVVNQQKQQLEVTKATVDSLRSEIEGLKKNKGDSASGKVRSGFETVGLTADFVDSNGERVKAGHYMVIGSFTVAENANKVLKRSLDKGYKDAAVIKNIKTNVLYVYVLKSHETDETLRKEIEKVRKEEAPDSWIYHLED